jgi:hypothetical protein
VCTNRLVQQYNTPTQRKSRIQEQQKEVHRLCTNFEKALDYGHTTVATRCCVTIVIEKIISLDFG